MQPEPAQPHTSRSSRQNDPLQSALRTIEANAKHAIADATNHFTTATEDERPFLTAVVDIQERFATIANCLAEGLAQADRLISHPHAR